MAVPYTFATATTAIPLSNLDSNFATPVTIGNTAVTLGNTVTSVGNLTLTNTTISSVSTPITAAQGGTGLASPGTSGNVLTSNGTNWVSSIPTSNYTGFKNRIINGAMQIDQRNAGAAQTYTAGAAAAYGIDRFIAFCSGANVTGQRISGLSTFQYGYRFTGAASVTGINFGQRIESYNIYDCASSTVTLSAVIANSLLTTVTWAAYYANTADNFSAITLISSGSFTVTSTATKYSTNITLPANAQNGVYIVFSVGAQTSGTWDITGVQLEAGSIATSFDVRDYGRELIMCQRYFYQTNRYIGLPITADTLFGPCVAFPVTMRATPTLLAGVTFTARSGNNGTPTTSTGVPGIAASPDGINLYNSANNWTVSASNQISFTGGFSAEL
jgi:hypothetical protein